MIQTIMKTIIRSRLSKLCFLALLCILVSQYVSSKVHADTTTQNGFTMTMTDLETNMLYPMCTGQGDEQTISVVNSIQPWLAQSNVAAHACVKTGQEVDIALCNSPLWSGQKLAFRRHGDQSFYLLNTMVGALTAKFISSTDNYVILEFMSSGNGSYETKLYVYDLLTSLIPEMIVNDRVLSYKFDIDKRTYYMWDKTDSTNQHQPNTYLVTDDGKYLAAYVDGMGFVKINLITKEVKKVYIQARGQSGTPSVDGISPNGRYIYGGGTLLGFAKIIDTEGCGDEFGHGFTEASLFKPCVATDIEPTVRTALGSQFVSVNATLSDSGGLTVDVYPQPYWDKITPKRVTLTRASEPPAPLLTYLALGDSYSSGEGDIDKQPDGASYYTPVTDYKGGCHISIRSYPYLLKKAWGVHDENMHSVACSGAQMVFDYGVRLDSYLGQGGRLAGLTDAQRQATQQLALDKHIPGRAPQLEFVKKYQPDVLTFTGGGNDVGFADILRYCASSVETCGFVKGRTGTMHDDLMASIDEQYGYTKRFLEQIKVASPKTKIYVIGYPKFLYDESICGLNAALLDPNETALINEGVERLNATLSRAAKDASVSFLNIEEALRGGKICEGSEYVTDPVAAFIANGSIVDQNMFHPNRKGHQKMAESILAAKKAADSGTGPQVPVVIPVRPDHKLVRQELTGAILKKQSDLQVSSAPNTYLPGSSVVLQMHSKPYDLATLVADASGALRWMGKLPSSLQSGIHLLTATGVDADHNPIQVQQFLTVTDTKPGDSSEDTVNICETVPYWYDEQGRDICASYKEAHPIEDDGTSIPVPDSVAKNQLVFEDIALAVSPSASQFIATSPISEWQASAGSGALYVSNDKEVKTGIGAITPVTQNESSRSSRQNVIWAVPIVMLMIALAYRYYAKK